MAVSRTDTQDSMMFQFEKKVDDLFIVTDTPERNRKRPVAVLDTQSVLDKAKETQNTKIVSDVSDEPRVKNLKKKIDDFELLKFEPDVENKNQVEKNLSLKKVPLSEKKVAKSELNVTNRSRSKTDTNTVYCKLKPPVESFKVKNSELNDNETIVPSIQAKVKYEPLIVIKKESGSYSSTNDGRVNFKKFRKIPKASQIVSSNTGSNTVSTNTTKKDDKNKFRSFKQEPFDLDSQFEMFISSSNR